MADLLDTLAQLGQTDRPRPGGFEPASAGDDSARLGTLLKRARARYFSLPLAVSLAELRTPLERSYRNTAYCTATLSQEDGVITGTYCGNRWCLVCNRIRTARAIERYAPPVREWQDRWMVTLTLKNVPAQQLPETLRGMVADFQAVKLGMRRTDRVKLIALRKLECTYNAVTDEYHPHFHLVVEGEVAARLLLKRWMERHPGTTSRRGQDIRRCDDAALGELFKYFTKLLAKTRHKTQAGKLTSAPVPAAALDVIFRSMRGRRVYQPVGFRVAASAVDDEAEIAPQQSTPAPTTERVVWEWRQSVSDWVDGETGECLTGYEPAANFRRLAESMGPREQLEAVTLLPQIRRLEDHPTEKIDERAAIAANRRRLASLPGDGPVQPVEYVSAAVQRLFDLSAERAAYLAQQLTGCDIGVQLALLPATERKPSTGMESWQQRKRAPRKSAWANRRQ